MANVLTRDMLAGYSSKQRKGLATVIAIPAAVVGVSSIVDALQGGASVLWSLPSALILLAVALRIGGPQDARSFRLYRREKQRPHEVHPDVQAIDLAAE